MKKTFVIIILLISSVIQAEQVLTRSTFLGLAPETAASGEPVVANQLFPGGTADVLGLQVGDKILSINDQTVSDFESMRTLLSEIKEGMTISVAIEREQKSLLLTGKAIGRQKESAKNAVVEYGEFQWRDDTIRTITYLPNTPRKDRASVMFIQGYTCDSIDYGMVPDITISQLLKQYVAAGFTVFKMEKPAVGDSIGSVECIDYDFNYENAAFHAGLAHFKSTEDINPDKVFIFGHSLGVLHGATIAAEGTAYGVMGYGGVFKNWHDYMQDVFSKQSVKYWGTSERQAQQNLDMIKPLLNDWMRSDKSWSDILAQDTTKQVIDSQLLSISGEQVMNRHYSFFRTISQHNFKNDWANSKSYVLMMHGDYDIQTIESGWQQEIAQVVNQHRPGTATSMSFERTEHALMQYPSIDALLDAMANRQFNPGNPGEYYNPEIAEASLKWMQNVLAESIDVTKPETIVFGETLSVMQNKLTDHCDTITSREIKPAQIPGVKNRQMQVDCEGFMMAGEKRLAEFVFKDDELLLVWILIDQVEIPAIENAMISTYGSPKYKSDAFSAFIGHRAALRKDIPEFLFYGQDAAAQFEAWFSSAL